MRIQPKASETQPCRVRSGQVGGYIEYAKFVHTQGVAHVGEFLLGTGLEQAQPDDAAAVGVLCGGLFEWYRACVAVTVLVVRTVDDH
jgi:hypothetical protein